MKLAIISFTGNGIALSGKIAEKVTDPDVQLYTKSSRYQEESDMCVRSMREGTQAVCEVEVPSTERRKIRFVHESLTEWAKQHMQQDEAILFIGACGIAVRAIAPNLTDKLHDAPVLVMDERGQYVIPILAGHVGGANELAIKLSEAMCAQAVITTATDLQNKFAVDLFAKKHHLQIFNKDGIAKVSSKVLAGETVTISMECGPAIEAQRLGAFAETLRIMAYPPTENVDIIVAEQPDRYEALLYLRPRLYVVGMGCRRGKDPLELLAFYRETLKNAGIEEEQIYALASIDKKKDEAGLIGVSEKKRIPFLVYSAEELLKVDGNFHTSAFVEAQVGVDNVCERAALAGCGTNGQLICEKHAKDGMTIAIAKRDWSITEL